MPDVLLFGATGTTGRLVAHALERKELSIALAGRDEAKLRALAADLGGRPIHIADASSPSALASALTGCRALLSCVGPFTLFGETAVRAALDAGVHYLDSCGEGAFIRRLIEEFDGPARERGVALAPAMGLDEIPADLAASLATEDMDDADLTLTYAFPTTASPGTIRSAIQILAAPGRFLAHGRRVAVAAGSRRRWAPLPPPVGPRPSISAPLAELELAPLHLRLRGLETYVAVGPLIDFGARHGLTSLAPVLRWAPARDALGAALARALPRVGGGSPARKGEAASEGWWTVLAEARRESQWRNVTLRGRDLYGTSARLLAAGATVLAGREFSASGVLSPVQAAGTDFWHKELVDAGVSIETYEGRWPEATSRRVSAD